MEQVIMMAMQTCQEYAQKSAAGNILTEFEVQMYEQLCRMIATYSKGSDLLLRKQMVEFERDTLQAEAEHREWLDAQDD